MIRIHESIVPIHTNHIDEFTVEITVIINDMNGNTT